MFLLFSDNCLILSFSAILIDPIDNTLPIFI